MADSDSPIPPSPAPFENPNPKIIPNYSRNSKNTIHIGGIPVEFPYQPYGTQLAFMNRVISTLDRSQRDGHCHALLESPTGTGKSLSLLCSTIAWQQNQKSKNIRGNLNHSSFKPNPEAVTDPINHGGGFIPETQPSGNPSIPPPATTSGKKEKQKLAPTIFYSSRTHSQISQVIREYKKTSYRVPMAVLGSRKHYCTNPYLRGEDKVDEQCKLLLKNKEDTCPEFKNVHKVKSHPSLQKGGCHEVHDIEDLVKVGQVVKGCSYFAARSMAQESELVFCPYNYIINPVIRAAMEIDISGSIIILDEAHNIEDIARDAGSIDLDEEVLIYLQTELGQLSLNDGMTYQPLFEMTQDILSWIDSRKNTLVKREFQRYFYCWTGNKALTELREANMSLQSFPILQECAKKAIKAASEAEPDIAHLSGLAATTLEGLFSSLSYFFSGNGIHANDYELALQRFVKKDEGNAAGGWTTTFNLWCLNPAVVFKSIAESSQSVILTSGTLSPLNTFSSELGVQFGTCLEAPHVVDVDSQIWAAAISNGPGNYPLNASYKTSDEYAFQDSVGASLEEICKVVPGGCLAFFPSYKLLDKVSTRWQETGLWSRLNAQKSLFVEPRGSSQESFEAVLKGYYNTISHGARQVSGKKARGKKLGLKKDNSVESTKDTKKKGAAFLAVCRGKVSEGMDFSDDNARAVVIVGIPFPNIYDVKVAQKKKFNDVHESSKNLLSGNEWYCQQAFRALNQAAGRCIRHRYDYGAIIFLDERFHKERNRAHISKWLRKSIRLYSCFEESIDGLKSFFRDVKVHTGIAANPSLDQKEECEIIELVDKGNVTKKKHNNKVTKSTSYQKKGDSNPILVGEKAAGLTHPSIPVAKYDSPSTRIRSGFTLTDDKDASVCTEYIDLECDSEKGSRCSTTPRVALLPDDIELTSVKETPDVNCRTPETTHGFVSKNDYTTPQTNNPFTAFLQQSSFHRRSSHNLNASPTNFMYSAIGTPKMEIGSKAESIEPEAESPWSVNSNDWKRRKVLSSVQDLDRVSFSVSSITTADAAHVTEECKFKSFPSSKAVNSEGSNGHSGVNNMDEKLRIFCSQCKNPLGLPENDLFVTCSRSSTSKVHLMSLQQKNLENATLNKASVDVLVSDTSSLDKRIYGAAREGASGQGIWCKEDGCVFNSIFCPFCVESDNCLGVQIVATDASNINFQNKILFYLDRLEMKIFEAEIRSFEGPKEKVSSPYFDSNKAKNVGPADFEKFAYSSPTQDSGGWRNTRSRMRLPKKG
ncbi:hypothetical protein ACP275_03G007400 [Erythranthe tilingii]